MNDDDQLQSAKNACKVLPPNYKVDGRHTAENVKALCGFEVTQDMLDTIYAEEEA
jgi:hypothetical protein